jgi:lysozyme family protein
MVDPVSDEERDSTLLKIKAGFVMLVGTSAGLMTLQADVGPVWFAGATVAGLLVGAVLVRLAFPARSDLGRRPPRRRR